MDRTDPLRVSSGEHGPSVREKLTVEEQSSSMDPKYSWRQSLDDYRIGLHVEYTDLDTPCDLQPISLPTLERGEEQFFEVYESSAPVDQEKDSELEGDEGVTDNRNETTLLNGRRGRRVASDRDKLYRSDREYVKRQSHKKMIWFFRKVGLRHPAAVRTHLEKVKHPEFELPNLQCVVPHSSLTVAFDDKPNEVEDGFKKRRKVGTTDYSTSNAGNRSESNMTFYQLYCATPSLVDRVKRLIGEPNGHDEAHNKRVLAFIADIVGRLLWHNNRTHTVMFAKSDHYNRECFLLYSRQAEPTPFMMKSDKYFCRRHDSEKFRFLGPQPDLTRANSIRMSSASSIYVVGCNVIELWESFPYDYRITHCRQMKALYDRVKRLDPSVVENAFSAVNLYANGEHLDSPYVEVASKTSFDVLSTFLRDTDLQDIVVDDSVAYKNYLERFITVGVLNVHCMLKSVLERRLYGGYSNINEKKRLNDIVLHHVHYRREVRELRTNRIFYYRNANDFVCSLSLLDDMFEGGITVEDIGEQGERNQSVVYFYDVLQPFEYDETEDVNDLVMQTWEDVQTMIQESSFTIGNRLTTNVLKGPLPEDPFYPNAYMSPTDVAIDRMLERSIKHSKKLQLLTPPSFSSKRKRDRRSNKRPNPSSLSTHIGSEEPLLDENVILNALSKYGENRLQEGYVSPPRPSFNSDHHVEHNGQHFHVKISGGEGGVSNGMRRMNRNYYGEKPSVQVDNNLVCLYLIDPTDEKQIQVTNGWRILNKTSDEFIKLRVTDRIVRVFAVQATGESYVVKPYVYFVFRNMNICSMNNELAERLFTNIEHYENFHGFNIFNDNENQNIHHYQMQRDVGKMELGIPTTDAVTGIEIGENTAFALLNECVSQYGQSAIPQNFETYIVPEIEETKIEQVASPMDPNYS